MGFITLTFQPPVNRVVSDKVGVLRTIVAFIIWRDPRDNCMLYLDNFNHVLCGSELNVIAPLDQRHWHPHPPLVKEREVLYTRPEFLKVHKTFSHPASHELYNLSDIRTPVEKGSNIRRTLGKSQKQCDTRQNIAHALGWYKVSLPSFERIKFGDTISLRRMVLEAKTALHMVNTVTQF